MSATASRSSFEPTRFRASAISPESGISAATRMHGAAAGHPTDGTRPIRVLYSFPHKIGAGGICYAAWQHVAHLSQAGVDVTVFPGVLQRPLPDGIRVSPTLARGRFRIPYKLLGRMGACRLHDRIVARRLAKDPGRYDLVHCFALGSLETLRTAAALGIPTVLERCNAHTRYAYEVVERECAKLGISMPPDNPHAFHADYLKREELEYEAADTIFCPSDFVARTFVDQGHPPEKLARFQYGCHEDALNPDPFTPAPADGLTVLFAAACAPRKGLHYALEAWVKSSASATGRFLIVGDFIPGYAEHLSEHLAHPGVEMLGFRQDLPEIMRSCDVMVLPSIEEGSALVTYDARAAGCVLLVSDATGAVCEHGRDALVHAAGDVVELTTHLNRIHEDRDLLARLRKASLSTTDQLTWAAAGRKMEEAYRQILDRYHASANSVTEA